MSGRRVKYVRKVCLSVSILILAQLWSGAHAQNAVDLRTVKIGVLVGRTDPNQFKLLTNEGLVPVLDAAKGKAFAIFSQSPKEIVLQYYKSPDIRRYNPNRVIIRFYETERALISALILEEVDYAELKNEASAREVQQANNHFRPLPLLSVPNTVKMLCYNIRNSILKSRNVRVAFSYAIRHNQIIKKILGAKANLAKGPLDNDSDFYNPQMTSFKYNPKRAIQLLQETGWKDSDGDGILEKNGHPLKLTLYYQKGVRIDEQVAREIKINLLKINVDIQPKPLTKHEINRHLVQGDFEIVLMEHTFTDDVQSIADFFSSTGTLNYMWYRNRTFENYLRFYYEDENKSKRKTLIKSMQKVVNTDQPVTFLYFKWVTHHLVNVNKFEHYRDTQSKNRKGQLLPFEQWIVKKLKP